MAYCIRCSKMINEYDSGYYARNMLCVSCYEQKRIDSVKMQCMRCMRYFFPQDVEALGGHEYCSGCYKAIAAEMESRRCYVCKRVLEDWEDRVRAPDGRMICKKCHDNTVGKFGMKQCALCNRMAKVKMVVGDKFFCIDCYPKIRKRQGVADKLVAVAEMLRDSGRLGKT